MKNTIKKTTILLFTAAILGSCGNKTENVSTDETLTKTEDSGESFSSSCTNETKINVLVENYKYGVKEEIKYAAPNFEVKQSNWKLMTDSTAELSLMNYTNEERAAGRTDEQVEILAKITTKKGKKIIVGDYKYMDYESGMACQVTINSEKGKVYFNGSNQGGMSIKYFDKNSICGTFDLKVDQPEVSTVGTVKLNGTFKVENK